MAEQLELFGEAEFPTQEAKSDRDQTPSDSHHSTKSSRNEEPPDGFVWVTVGSDKDLTETASEHAARLGLPKLAKSVSVVWNKKMRTAAGRAFYQTGRIELNPKLQTLPPETRDEEIRRTFLHELAHLVSFARHQGKRIQPHGIEWKNACADLGIPDENRCHDLNFQPRRQKRKFAYECPVCDSIVERVRRLKRKVACYDCCRKHSGGRFDHRFVLREHKLS